MAQLAFAASSFLEYLLLKDYHFKNRLSGIHMFGSRCLSAKSVVESSNRPDLECYDVLRCSMTRTRPFIKYASVKMKKAKIIMAIKMYGKDDENM